MATQRRGTITRWKDDRGFGFIRPDEGGDEVFFHVSGLSRNQGRPADNVAVAYSVERDAKSRKLRAVNVQLMEQASARRPRAAPAVGPAPAKPLVLAIVFVGAFFLALAALVVQGALPALALAAYGLCSLITFVAYRADKLKAMAGKWRTPEASLHLLELFGGWPGGLIAQWYYRHKNGKPAYQIIFWLAVLANLGALALWVVGGGW
jgi:uncharacterized membrane protein YsdA (DUF1294 family)/cold shock CspA family protein